MKRNVSIILVNYKTSELTKQCIQSLYDKVRDVDFEIYVVDNNSNDNIEIMLQENFPDVKFIQS